MALADPVFTPTHLGPLALRNRIVKCGTNEGLSHAGDMTDALIEWHRRYAAGGVALTTLAYCSVAAVGRTFTDQIWMREAALPGLRRFVPPVSNTNEQPGGFARMVGTSGPVSSSILAGNTWNFQAWHRDALAGSSNFSDAVSVLFH